MAKAAGILSASSAITKVVHKKRDLALEVPQEDRADFCTELELLLRWRRRLRNCHRRRRITRRRAWRRGAWRSSARQSRACGNGPDFHFASGLGAGFHLDALRINALGLGQISHGVL